MRMRSQKEEAVGERSLYQEDSVRGWIRNRQSMGQTRELDEKRKILDAPSSDII